MCGDRRQPSSKRRGAVRIEYGQAAKAVVTEFGANKVETLLSVTFVIFKLVNDYAQTRGIGIEKLNPTGVRLTSGQPAQDALYFCPCHALHAPI